MSRAGPAPKTTTSVTLEDQQKINRFARLNSRHVELSGDITDSDRELENVREATEAVEELELTSDDVTHVAYRVGDVFFNIALEDAVKRLQSDKESLTVGKDKCIEEKGTLEAQMDTLKKELYGKFGDQINLDPEAE